MRNALAIAVLVVLFGSAADVSRPAAQPAQEEWGPMAPAPDWFQPPPRREVRRVRTTEVHHHRPKVHKRHIVRHVVRPPNQREIAERKGFQRLSDLVNFPKFFPGLGILYVKPDTMPTGPYLGFDHKDRLVATVYMVSIKDIDAHKTLEATGFEDAPVDHVTIYFNAGHPGMDMPHYHVVIWHVSKKDESLVAQ